MKPRNLTMGVSYGSSHRAMEYMNRFKERIEERSNGKITVTIYSDESLVKNADIYQALLDGIIDIGEAEPGYSFASFPLGSGFFQPGLPFANSTSASYSAIEWFRTDYEENRAVHFLYGIGMTPSAIMSTKKIETVEDFRGMQIRATGFAVDAISTLGASPVGINPPECYEGLLKGTIDAVLMPDEVLMNWNFAEVCDFYAR